MFDGRKSHHFSSIPNNFKILKQKYSRGSHLTEESFIFLREEINYLLDENNVLQLSSRDVTTCRIIFTRVTSCKTATTLHRNTNVTENSFFCRYGWYKEEKTEKYFSFRDELSQNRFSNRLLFVC